MAASSFPCWDAWCLQTFARVPARTEVAGGIVFVTDGPPATDLARHAAAVAEPDGAQFARASFGGAPRPARADVLAFALAAAALIGAVAALSRGWSGLPWLAWAAWLVPLARGTWWTARAALRQARALWPASRAPSARARTKKRE